MKSKKIIGILAGMGPKSTAPFLNSVVDECQAQYGARYDEDFPHMMIYSLPVPFRAWEPFDQEKVKEMLCQGLKKLEAAGVDFIAIPCNTVHTQFDHMKTCVKVPLLNMIEETLKSVGDSPRRIALMASQVTVASNLYQKGLRAHGHTYVEKRQWQESVDTLISGIKKLHDATELDEIWTELVGAMKEEGVDVVIAGCTDISVVSRDKKDIDVIDSSACLAKAVVEKWLED